MEGLKARAELPILLVEGPVTVGEVTTVRFATASRKAATLAPATAW